MLALIAAVLFLLALIMELAALALGPLTATVLTTAGFVLVALYLAGIGKRTWR
jgi:hypothetical protein